MLKQKIKKLTVLVLTAALAVTSAGLIPELGLTAEAKTQDSTKAQNIFFYVKNDEGKSVLMKVMSLDELKKLSHGQLSADGAETGQNYYMSSTDNYPTTQYCEARGFTIPELVEYVKNGSSVPGASAITYQGDDLIRFMATDSYGNYMHSWTYNDLYGVDRYYFEGLYDASNGWNTGWEISGEENSKYGLSLEEYHSTYRAGDSYYDAKRKVFDTGKKTDAILAVESYSGRTTTETLSASTEIGLAGYIAANGGTVMGSLKNVLEDTWALRLCVPMSEADLMSAHRTAYDNFKWVYNMELDMAGSGAPKSQGTVAQPTASASVSADGKTLTVTMSCSTPGAQIYYSFTDAPQTLYTGPVSYDISGRNLESTPVTFYMTAVKEGYDDAGQITVKYPQSGVRFKTVYSTMTGTDLVLEAEDDVTAEEWNTWTSAILGISAKTPSSSSYVPLEASQYKVDKSSRKITIDKSVLEETGSYSFAFYAKGFSNKNVSLTAKKAAPSIAGQTAPLGSDVTFTFDDGGYQNGLYLYITAPGESESTMISASYLDRTQSGKVTIKKEYYDSSSCKITSQGSYTLEFVNNSYAPSSQKVTLDIGDGGNQGMSPGNARFSDVPSGSWYYDAVNYVADNGYFSGTSAAEFSPGANMTRGMFVTVLGRMAVIDTAQYTDSSFSDVPAGKYYSPYVQWASANGIVSGVGNGKFNPDGQITREQMAVIMYNYVKFTGGDTSADSGRFDGFSDRASVSSWAKEAMIWAAHTELINGSNGNLSPSGNATRAQVAQIVKNLCEKFVQS